MTSFSNGDILIFRKKHLQLYSFITLDLDNHIGVVFEINKKFFLCHFIKTNFKYFLLNLLFNYNYECGKSILTPIDYFKNQEYYHYKIVENINIKEDLIIKTINKSKKHCEYLSDKSLYINFMFGKKLINNNVKYKGHTCLSYVMWFLSELSLYDITHLNNDYYKRKHYSLVGQDKNNVIDGLLVNYKLVGGHNVGKKDLSKFNPYKWAYIISFLYNFITLLFLKVKNKNGETVPFYKTIIGLFLITIFATFGGYYFNKKIDSKTKGRRYIGCIIGIAFVNIIFCENILNIDQNDMLYINYMFSMPRIFFTRSASWIANDLPGKINKKTLRPYDTAFYEAIYEGLVPFLFMVCTQKYIIKKHQNIITTIIYSGSRFYIEFYKNSYIKNNILTLGQIDSIINVIIIYWYITCSADIPNKLFQYLLLNVFFFDINNRISLNKYNTVTHVTKHIKLIWKKSYNSGFYNGHFKEKGKIFKLIYPLTMLCIYNNLEHMYLFNCFALLNIFERFLYGYVTDYLTIHFYHFKTLNLNYSDIIINLFTIYFIIRILLLRIYIYV